MFLSDFIYSAFALIGFYYLFSIVKLLIRNTVYPLLFSKRKDIKTFGKWIVITGATDGIGKGFAQLLARDGYNLVLISRSEDKLKSVKSEIMAANSVDIKLIASDFTKTDIYEKIKDSIKDLDVAMLINNVGMSFAYPNYLVDDYVTNDIASNILNCNCLSAVLMTKIVLNSGMLRKGGVIINISSGFGKITSPLLSIYGASKSFINSFSLSMQSELKNSKVIIQNVEPYVVATNMSRQRESLLCPSPISFANSVLNRVGTCSSTHGCFIHELQAWVVEIIPNFLVEKLLLTNMLLMRKKALYRNSKNN